jgi:hypothetical protein
MCSLEGRIEPGAPQRSGHARRDRSTGAQATAWRPHPDTDLPRHPRRSVVTQIDGYGRTDLMGERQAIVACALPPHQEFARFPIQSIEGQGGPCTGPEAEPRQQAPDGIIALSFRGATVTARHQPVDVRGVHEPGQAGSPPMGYRWHGGGEVVGEHPALAQQAETAPPRGGEQLGTRGAIATRLWQPEVRHVLGAEDLRAGWVGTKATAEKTPGRLEVVPHRRWRQTTLVPQVVLKVAGKRVVWTRVGLDNPAGHQALIAQVLKPWPHDGAIITRDTIAPIAVVQKLGHALCIAVCGREGLSLEPAAEVGEQAHGIRCRPARIALGHQLLRKGVDRRTHRTGVQLPQHNGIGKNGGLIRVSSLADWLTIQSRHAESCGVIKSQGDF